MIYYMSNSIVWRYAMSGIYYFSLCQVLHFMSNILTYQNVIKGPLVSFLEIAHIENSDFGLRNHKGLLLEFLVLF